MRFRFEQRFGAPADAVARAFTDPALYAALDALPNLGRPEVLDRREDGDRVELRVRYRFTGELNAAARRALDAERLTWVESSVHDLATRTASFELHPDHYGSRLQCRGTYRFEEGAGDTVRHVEGDLVVRYPIVGRAVERAIVSGLERHLHDEVAVVEQHLAG